MNNTKRICLWSSPRNLSTALMYSFAQRKDTLAVDEPLYAHYLRVTNADHPGKEEVLQSQEKDGAKVIAQMVDGLYDKPVVFFKQMTHHLVEVDTSFLSKTLNIIYIRNPKRIISSYAQVRKEVIMDDIGIAAQWQLYQFLQNNNYSCIVLDSGELLKNPEKVLTDLCTALTIPFDKAMLHWQSGQKKEDGVWAKYWYANVHQSTGFAKQPTSERPLPKYLESLYQESKVYYDLLIPHSIKA
ncbi:sulfotransferase family protein [Ilyomonas limi]|uniref:Sulfotransferase family protein n=1 Tax=Ilyomonas limi TaxID=2575867 RepID=A0A4U3KZK9_9BACT|nr:sulfotransferase family protein [Ilyomonas limi]TKK68231.1 sulfotransferase family protein [Ilyomonas limi]